MCEGDREMGGMGIGWRSRGDPWLEEGEPGKDVFSVGSKSATNCSREGLFGDLALEGFTFRRRSWKDLKD
jgi:hypothetical protein